MKNIPLFTSHMLNRFQAKAYFLSSQGAYQKFLESPRRYLLPPMPSPPCKVSVVGPPLSGKSTLSGLLARRYGATVVDVEELLLRAALEQDQSTKDPAHTGVEETQRAVDDHRPQEEGMLYSTGALFLFKLMYLIIIFIPINTPPPSS